jgi:hypothetical protein
MTEVVLNLAQFVLAVHTHSSTNTSLYVTVNLFRRCLGSLKILKPTDQDILSAIETMNVAIESQSVGMCCILYVPALYHHCPRYVGTSYLSICTRQC